MLHRRESRSSRRDTSSSTSGSTLRIRGMSANFGAVEVLHEIDLDVAAGEILSLLGPSGCGKTTLLRAVAGLGSVRVGTIDIDGKVMSSATVHTPPERRRVGMVFQDGALFPHLSVEDNLRFGLRRTPEASQRVSEVLELVELTEFADRLPGTLSGGERQRVALARALAPRPSVILLDEPFSALDAGLRDQLRRDVRRILTEVGITTIVVTHDQDEAFALGDRVAVMRAGRVVQAGAPSELYEEPASPWIARFVGEANTLVGTVHGSTLSTVIGELTLRPDLPDGSLATAAIRPEQLSLRAGTAGSIVAVDYYGHDARYEVDLGSAAPTPITVRTTDTRFRTGDLVDLHFRGDPVIAWAATSE